MFGLGIREYLIIGLAAALLALGWYAKHETEVAGAERAARLTAEQIARNNAEQVGILQRAMVLREQAIEAQQAQAAAVARRAQQDRQEINHAPPTDDGPLSPVLRGQLGRMWERAHGAARGEGRGGDGAGAATDPR